MSKNTNASRASGRVSSSDRPSISVAMATYNGAAYLQEQLNSIAAQTVLPSEVVISDDGSSDATLEIIARAAETAPFPIHVSQNVVRLRYADNFLKAAKLTKGELIAFCDQDDIWTEDKLATCLPYFDDPEVLLTLHTSQTLLQGGVRGHLFPEIRRSRVVSSNASDIFENQPGFAMICRRAVLELQGDDQRPANLYSHDHLAWFLAASAGKIAKISSCLTLYRQHESNVYGSPARKTAAEKLSIAATIPKYDELARGEAECARFLQKVIERCPAFLLANLKRTIASLERRSALHHARAELYFANLGFLQRVLRYAAIHRSGGYFPSRAKVLLGPRAAIKDFFLGVLHLGKKGLPNERKPEATT